MKSAATLETSNAEAIVSVALQSRAPIIRELAERHNETWAVDYYPRFILGRASMIHKLDELNNFTEAHAAELDSLSPSMPVAVVHSPNGKTLPQMTEALVIFRNEIPAKMDLACLFNNTWILVRQGNNDAKLLEKSWFADDGRKRGV